MRAITTETPQKYVIARAKENGNAKRPVSHVTTRKELGTLSSIWNRLALPLKLVSGPAPTKGQMHANVVQSRCFRHGNKLSASCRAVAIHRERRRSYGAAFSSVDIWFDKVRLGIAAPIEISGHRQEVYEAIQRENWQAKAAWNRGTPVRVRRTRPDGA